MTYCDCFEKVARHEFEACCPEHQVVVDKFRETLDTVTREVMVKAITRLARQFIDDELILSEDVIDG